MRSFLAILFTGILWVPLAAFAQEVAGRVLAVARDVAILRADQRIVAQAGTEVRSGDTLLLGEQSNAQVRFTDDSIVSLRPNTRFRIADYVFQDQRPETQRAFFELLKGGLRTVTGAIGRLYQRNYQVRALSATIGIRGTGYVLVECDDNCRDPDGAVFPNGTYGAVTEGRVGVVNQVGDREFGVDQFFYVASPATPPQELLGPPAFLIAERARASRQQVAQAAQKGGAAASSATVTQSGAAGTAVPTELTAPELTPVAFQVTATPHPETLLSPNSFSGTSFYRLQGPFNIAPTSCSPPGTCSNGVAGEITLGVNYALQRAGISIAVQGSDGTILNIGSPISTSGFPITIVGNQITFNATYNLADFPQNTGAFRCFGCNVDNTPGFLAQITISGTIVGSQATVSITGVGQNGGSGSFDVVLTQQAPPNNAVAAIAVQRQGGGTDARSSAFWGVQRDASGRLLQFGPNIGELAASVGTATNNILGSAPSAGNLVWGTWTGGGSRITDSNYNTFTTTSGQAQVWITGDATNSLPPSLGTLTFTPVGSFFTGTNQRLNSGSLTADFVNLALGLSLNATNITAGNTFQMDAATGFSPTTGRFSAGFNSITCTGPCIGGTPSGSFAGFFAGPQAQGAGVVFSAGFGVGTGVTGGVAFGRGPP